MSAWRWVPRLQPVVPIATLVVCGLLAACSEAPKLSKAPPQESTPTAEQSSPPPAEAPPPVEEKQASPEPSPPALTPGAPAPDDAKEAEKPAAPPSASDQARETMRRYEAAPRSFEEEGPSDNQASQDSAGGGGSNVPAAPTSEPAPQPKNAPSMAEPEMPAGGAAPPSAASGIPTAPAPLGQGAPPPVAEAPSSPPPPPPPPSNAAAPEPRLAPPVAGEAPLVAFPPAAAPSLPPAAAARARATAVEDPPKTYDVVPVFYGTDRATEPDPNRLQFGAERGHKLQLGRALITVPLVHKVPHIERPWVIEIPYFKVKLYEEKEDPSKHFTVQEISSLTEEQMLALVKQRLAQSKSFKDHAFVFVHGFNTSFDCALYRTAQIAYDLKFDGAPFLYSWPSGGKVASYTYDHGSVEQAEGTLSKFLELVVQKTGAKSISLIAHSMGNELLLRVLEKQKLKVPKGVVISQVILAAPDVDRDKFNMIAREITNFAKGVTLYAASNDRALGYSAKFWGGVPRAGDVPTNGGPLIIPGVDTIDVTAVSTDALGLNHSGYAENPTLLNDVKALVEFGIRPPDKREKNLLTVESAAGTFWRFQASE